MSVTPTFLRLKASKREDGKRCQQAHSHFNNNCNSVTPEKTEFFFTHALFSTAIYKVGGEAAAMHLLS